MIDKDKKQRLMSELISVHDHVNNAMKYLVRYPDHVSDISSAIGCADYAMGRVNDTMHDIPELDREDV